MLVLVGCGRADEGVPISLGSRSSAPSATPEEDGTLRVGIGAMISPAATFEFYEQLIVYLGKKVGRLGVPVQRETYAEINDLLEQRRIDCALICTGAYLAGWHKFGMEVLVVPVLGGTPTYHSLIIVRADSDIRRFEQLKGRNFAFVDRLSNTGRLYPISRILSLGYSVEQFAQYEYMGSHDRAIDAVRTGVVDGAAVDQLIFEYLSASDPTRVQGLRIIEKSPAYGAPPVVIHPSIDPATRESLRDAFLSLSAEKSGRRILEGLRIDRFIRPSDGMYDSVAALEAKVRRYREEKLPR